MFFRRLILIVQTEAHTGTRIKVIIGQVQCNTQAGIGLLVMERIGQLSNQITVVVANRCHFVFIVRIV